jgi:predicted DNA-binding transcriptional regulator AlpA
MPKRLRDISHLPGWPALLSAEQAATYCGMSSESFDALVKAEVFPGPVKLPIRLRLWSRATIDAAVANAETEAQGGETTRALCERIAQQIRAEAAERALDRSRTPAERKAGRVQARQAHAERAAARARQSRSTKASRSRDV